MIFNKIIKKIKKKILKENDYSFSSNPEEQEKIKLSDNIILYYNGNQWKIIPLLLCLSYPIIYDKYFYEDKTIDVTIVVCPITLRCVMFQGKLIFETYDNYIMILRDNNNYIPIDLNKKFNNNFIIQNNKRMEVKIMTLKNSIIYAPDALIIKCDKKINPVLNISYYTDDKDIYGNKIKYNYIHPKTLVYISNFSSESNNEEIYAILLGNDSNNEYPTGYNIVESKLNNHLIKYRAKIIKKDGYIMPILWYIAKNIYKKYKVVYLK